uniref:Uncharacterized protein n=1 Tax=Eutreptiella gymnastica TaxID=73025 RepID=A0A7S4FHM6_9EUGL
MAAGQGRKSEEPASLLNPLNRRVPPARKALLVHVDVVLCFVPQPRWRKICLQHWKSTRTDAGLRYVQGDWAALRVEFMEPPLLLEQTPVDLLLSGLYQKYSARSIALYNWGLRYWSGASPGPTPTLLQDRQDHRFSQGPTRSGLFHVPLMFSPEMNAHAEKVMGSQLHHSYVAVQYRAGAWLWTTEGPATIKQETQIIAAKAIELMESRPGLRVFVASDLFATRPLDMFMAIKIRERLGWTARALRDYKNKQTEGIKASQKNLQNLSPVTYVVPEKYVADIKTTEAILDWIIAANSSYMITNSIGRFRVSLHDVRWQRGMPSWQCNVTRCWQGRALANPIRMVSKSPG